METVVQFLFRGKLYSCVFFIDIAETPNYIFCFLEDKELMNEFSGEVTIKTDGRQMLPKKDDYPALVELRQAIFSAVKNTMEFVRLVKYS
jgi:hypothetical protein